MYRKLQTLLAITLLIVVALPVGRAGPPECAGLGAMGQELCLEIQETDRAGAPTGAGFQFRGPAPTVIATTIGDYAVNLTVDLVEGPGGMSLTATGTFEKTGAGETRLAMVAEGGMSSAPLPGVGSLRLEGSSTGTATIQLGAGAGFDDLALGDPLYSPFPRICDVTLFNAGVFDCIEIDQPLREGSIAITIILSVDILDTGTIVDIPAGAGLGDVPAGGIEDTCLDVPSRFVELCDEEEDVSRAETPVLFGEEVAATSFFFHVEEESPIEFTIIPQGAPLYGAFFSPLPFLPPQGLGGGLMEDSCLSFVDSFLYPADTGDTRVLVLAPGTYYVVIHREAAGPDVPFTWSTHYAGCIDITDCDGNGVDDPLDIETGTYQDCNDNAIPDLCDLDMGTSGDENEDGVPDECQRPCDLDSTCEDCDDGVDNNGDGFVDCADPACDGDAGCPVEDCANGVDDDGDGFLDCLDPECYANGGCATPEDCGNGIDDDGDGDLDCQDADCSGDALCGVEDCADGLDNDGDGLIDCVDEDCVEDPACSAEICDDGTDNDGDGAVDCDDTDCIDSTLCFPETCDDGVDNDGDGLVDCEDPGCAENDLCLGPPFKRCDASEDGTLDISDVILIAQGIFLGEITTGCLATFDCNTDKAFDISDVVFGIRYIAGGGLPPSPPFQSCGPSDIAADCDVYRGCGPEDCLDGIDNNSDGLIDCRDPTCFGVADCTENCTDGIDNDDNGLIDCADPVCAGAPKAPCATEVCDDMIDNDGDFLVDCDDSDCESDPSCQKEICDDFADNDGDGAVDCADPDCASDPKCLLGSGDRILQDGRDSPSFPGVVVIQLASGMLQTVFLKNRFRYMNPNYAVPIEPEIIARSVEFPGTLKDFEKLDVPLERQPAAALEEPPVPMPDDASGLQEFRRRIDLQCAQQRCVVVTQEGQGAQAVCVIRVYDGLGMLRSTLQKPGEFKKAIYNESTGEKTVVVEKDGMIQWIVFDIVTGGVIVSSTFGLQTTIEIVDIELVGNNIFILERWRGGVEVRVRIFPSGQTTPIATLFIPGEFVTAAGNGSDIKAVVTQKDGTVFQDLVTLKTSPPSTKGLAQNGIGGTHQHLQHDASLGRDRFVEVVYNKDRNQTTVRILDGETGTIVATHIFNGKYRHVRKAAGTGTIAPRKIFVVERQGETDAHVVDLNTGQRLPVKTLPGRFRRLSVKGGSATLETTGPSGSVSFRVR